MRLQSISYIKQLRLAGATLAVLGAAAVPAGAHSSATCVVGGGEARCVGTIAGRAVSPAPSPGSLQVAGPQARLTLELWPLLAIFTPSLDVNADLTCSPALPLLHCAGTGTAGSDPIAVSATGTSGGDALVTISDSASPAAPAPQARRHHHRARRHRR